MNIFSKLFAIAAVSLAATGAHAATISGSVDIAGLYTANPSSTVTSSSKVTTPSGFVLDTDGELSGLSAFNGSAFTLGFTTDSANDGAYFTALLGPDVLTFTVVDTVFTEITGSGALDSFDIKGNLAISGTGFDTTLASFVLSGSSILPPSTYALSISTDSVLMAPPVPLPASVLLLGGGLGALAMARRKSKG